MEYFTLADDLEKARYSKRKSGKRILLFSSIFLTVFLLLRGIDVVTVEYNNAYLSGNHKISKEVYEEIAGGNKVNETFQNSSIKTNDSDRHLNLAIGISFSSETLQTDFSNSAESKYLADAIKKRFSEEQNLGKKFEFATISVK